MKLQNVLSNLITCSLTAKHLHWVVRGAHFQPTHELLDQLVESLHGHIDTLAERMMYLGGDCEVLPYSGGVPCADGRQDDHFAQTMMAEYLETLSDEIDSLLEDGLDLATEDVLIEIQRDLNKYHYFFSSHL